MHRKSDVLGGGFIPSLLALSLVALPTRSQEPPSEANTDKLVASVDLRPLFDNWGLERRQQGGRPTCSVFTVAGALEFALAKCRPPGERLSVEFLNWAANQKSGDAKDGGFFSSMWDGFSAYGICREQDMPYRASFDPAQKPDAEILTEAKARSPSGFSQHWIKEWNVNTGLTDAEFLGVKRTLSQGWPVCGGFRWPKQEDWKEDVLQMCPAEGVFDGHSVLLVGYRDDARRLGGGVFIFRNTSHGGRDGFMPYGYARTYMNDALWITCGNADKSASSSVPTVEQRRGE